MARLPTVQDLGARPVPQSGRAIATVDRKAVAAQGAALEGLGAATASIGDMIADREFTAMAKERDIYVSDQLRSLLYDPENGFTFKQGRSAVDARKATLDALEKLEQEAGKGLAAGAQRKLEASLRSRMEQARNTVDTHTGRARNDWLNSGSNARIEASIQDARANPAAMRQEMERIAVELSGVAAREGWSEEELDLQIDAKVSLLHQNRAEQLATTSAISAYDFVRENRGNFLPSSYDAMIDDLEPLAKQERGRNAGRMAATDGPSSRYLGNLKVVESGGINTARNPRSTAEGPYQFLEGTWAELMRKYPHLNLTPEGRTDEAQNERAIAAFTADNVKALRAAGMDATGQNMYAAHFLGAGGAVAVLKAGDGEQLSSLVDAQVITANPHLHGMTVADFKNWISGKGFSGTVEFGERAGIEALLDIEDPIEREAALGEYELRTKVAAAEVAAQTRAAQQFAYERVLAGDDPTRLPSDIRRNIGRETMSALISLEKQMKTDTRPAENDPAAVIEIAQIKASGWQRFREMSLMDYVHRLKPSTFDALVEEQLRAEAPGTKEADKGFAPSTLMTTASRAVKAAALDEENEVVFQSRIIEWQDRFIAQNGKAPTYAEIDQQIGRMLTEVMIDPPGFGNKQSGNAFQIDYLGSPVDTSDDMSLDDFRASTISINGTEVSQAVLDATIDILRARFGAEPLPQDIVNFLIEGGYYD